MKYKVWVLALVLCFLVITPLAAQDTPATDAAATPWWNDRVFYEVFVRSFQDSDGDGIGDLQGLISKLDYLNDGDPATNTDLGITGIWLMPIFESPSYHGYDVTDYMQVNADYGTNDDFRQLMSEAHERGIAVIIDMVINHTSRQHPWFRAAETPGSQYDQWYRWSGSKPGQIGPWGQQVWYKDGNRYFYAVFWDGMPDLNLRNPAVTQEVNEIALFWLQDMGADGFRLDGARYYVEDENKLASSPGNLTWLTRYHHYVESVSPDALLLGEVWTSDFEVSVYLPESLDLVFGFDLATGMVSAAKSGTGSNMAHLQEQALRLYPPNQYAAFLTNHDQDRLMNQLGQNQDKARVAAALLLTNPGVPFIYYGEEVGMTGTKPDECIRTPMQWDSSQPTAAFISGKNCRTNQDTFNVAAQTDDPSSLLSHYRSLIQLRDEHPALRTGEFRLVESGSPNVYSFVCYNPEESLLIVINLSNASVSDYALTLAEGPFSGLAPAHLLYGQGRPVPPTFNASGGFDAYTPLPALIPFSTTIIQLNSPG